MPAQPILNCAALSPDKPIPCKNPEEGAAGFPPLPGLWPPCCSPVGRAAWPPEAEGQRPAWPRVVMVPQPLPVAQPGKKNAEPGKSLSVCPLGWKQQVETGLGQPGLVILWHWW